MTYTDTILNATDVDLTQIFLRNYAKICILFVYLSLEGEVFPRKVA